MFAIDPLTIRTLDRTLGIECGDQETRALLTATYGHMQVESGEPDLYYRVRQDNANGQFLLHRRGKSAVAPDGGAFLALFDEDITIELQKLRHDLYFVHAAVLTTGHTALMLVAKSGGGKSTLCWALLQQGFSYLSDELGPVDLRTLEVHPYPRALTLKAEPPPPYRLPPETLNTSRGRHVPVTCMPVRDEPAPLSAVFFLRYQPETRSAIRRISSAEAAVCLYANALNPLAHAGEGLDGAIAIANGTPGFALVTTDLREACALLTANL